MLFIPAVLGFDGNEVAYKTTYQAWALFLRCHTCGLGGIFSVFKDLWQCRDRQDFKIYIPRGRYTTFLQIVGQKQYFRL